MARRERQSSTTKKENAPQITSTTPDQRLIPNRDLWEEWPELFPPEDCDTSHTKNLIVRMLTISLVVLLFVLTFYAMAINDKQTLVEITSFVRTALIAVLCSAGNIWKKHSKD